MPTKFSYTSLKSLLTMPFCCYWYSIVNYLLSFLLFCPLFVACMCNMACPTLLSLPLPSHPPQAKQFEFLNLYHFLLWCHQGGLTIGCGSKETIPNSLLGHLKTKGSSLLNKYCYLIATYVWQQVLTLISCMIFFWSFFLFSFLLGLLGVVWMTNQS